MINQPLIIKYKPNSIEEYIFADKIFIKKILDNPQKNLNHMLFVSVVPGTGKTTLCELLAKLLKADYLKLNASDERGIDTIREKVKSFASTQRYNIKIPKIIHLDEVDGLTHQAQDILRGIMDDFQNNTRFLLTCNHENKIIEAIKSRCNIIRFKNPPKEQIKQKLKLIIKTECSETTEEDIDIITNYLIETYYPSIRNMINALQRVIIDKSKISINDFSDDFEIENKIYELIFYKSLGNRNIAEKMANFQSARTIWISEGLDLSNLLKFMYKKIWKDDKIKQKTTVLLEICETEYRMKYCDQEIQFSAGMLRIIK